ncbi:MAG: cupin domain-containing protein [Candidatus Eremiobacteraeota bacterium]|nr:cupin domain-containing protein [Candidatus Eremiobacteraeota bacterium]
MIAKLEVPSGWMWSAWQAERGIAFNSYLFERDGGCVAVDPLPLDDQSADQIADLGGVHTIVLTNRDHERAAAAFRERFDARVLASAAEATLFTLPIDGTFDDRDEVFPGAVAVALPHGKTAGEIALHIAAAKTAIVGDALIGAPAGALGLLPDDKLEDRTQFVFSLRRLWELQLETLLLCDGQPIFSGADEAIATLLLRAGGPAVHRINADEIAYRVMRPGKYACEDGEVGLLIGARKLGYRLARLPRGNAYCPLHWHVRAEEFFYVIEGRPMIRTLQGTIQCRPGDFIAFPTGIEGSHQVLNANDEDALVLLVGIEEEAVGLEACFYPDSDKVGMWTAKERLGMLRASPDLNYYDGELTP